MIHFSRMLFASIFAVGVSFAQKGPPEAPVFSTIDSNSVKLPQVKESQSASRSRVLIKATGIDEIYWAKNIYEVEKVQCLEKLINTKVEYIKDYCHSVQVVEVHTSCGDQEKEYSACCFVKSDLLNTQMNYIPKVYGPPEE